MYGFLQNKGRKILLIVGSLVADSLTNMNRTESDNEMCISTLKQPINLMQSNKIYESIINHAKISNNALGSVIYEVQAESLSFPYSLI